MFRRQQIHGLLGQADLLLMYIVLFLLFMFNDVEIYDVFMLSSILLKYIITEKIVCFLAMLLCRKQKGSKILLSTLFGLFIYFGTGYDGKWLGQIEQHGLGSQYKITSIVEYSEYSGSIRLFPVADPGFSRGRMSRGGCQPNFWQFFLENCMEMKKLRPRVAYLTAHRSSNGFGSQTQLAKYPTVWNAYGFLQNLYV